MLPCSLASLITGINQWTGWNFAMVANLHNGTSMRIGPPRKSVIFLQYWQKLSHNSHTLQQQATPGELLRASRKLHDQLKANQHHWNNNERVTTSNAKQRWVKHYSELCTRKNFVENTALDVTEPMPIMEDVDAKLTMKELSGAINSLVCSKASENDGSFPQLIWYCNTTLQQCWS